MSFKPFPHHSSDIVGATELFPAGLSVLVSHHCMVLCVCVCGVYLCVFSLVCCCFYCWLVVFVVVVCGVFFVGGGVGWGVYVV